MTDGLEPVFGSIEAGPGAAILARVVDLHANNVKGSTVERAWVELPPVGKPAPTEFWVEFHGGVILRCSVTQMAEPVRYETLEAVPEDDGAETLPFFD